MSDGTDQLRTDRAGLASIFGCSLNHVNKMRSRGMPRVAHGVYDIPACVQWRIEELTNRGALDADELPAVVEARTRLITAQERHKRLEIRRLEGELLDAEEVRTRLLELVQRLVTTLEGLPVRAAADLAASSTTAEAAAIMREHCHDARDDLAAELESLAAADEPGGEGSAPTAGADGRGVGRRRARRATGEPETGAVAD